MPRFAANLSTLYPEHPFTDRVAAAARDGFAAVEVQGPYAVPAEELRRALADARLPLVLMNAPAGDAQAGERGLAALPGREAEFDRSIERALDYARTLQAPRVHFQAGRPDPALPADEVRRTFLRNIGAACDALRAHGIAVTIEPINPRDIPGYWLQHPAQAVELIASLGRGNLGLQLDFYHLQIVAGDLIRHLEQFAPQVTHVQIAGVPDRHEPDRGEVCYSAVFAALDRLHYPGWVGCEYRPADPRPGGTSAGLGWLRRC